MLLPGRSLSAVTGYLIDIEFVRALSSSADQNDNVHVAYIARNLGLGLFIPEPDELRYATNATGEWTHYVIDFNYPSLIGSGVDEPFDDICSLALDSSGNVYIAYKKGDKLKFAHNDSGDWVVETITTVNGYRGLSLAIDSNAKAHIAVRDFTETWYITNASGAWDISTLDTVESWPVIKASMDDVLNVAYVDINQFNLRYATDAPGFWSYTTIVNTGGINPYTDLAVDSAGVSHINYYKTPQLMYASNSTGSWATEYVDSNCQYPSIAVNSTDEVFICYKDTVNSNLKYSKKVFGGWSSIGFDNHTTQTMIDLAFDTQNNFHVVCDSQSGLYYYTDYPTPPPPPDNIRPEVAFTDPPDSTMEYTIVSSYNSVYTLKGTAADSGGSGIDSVEVSFDWGGSWILANYSGGLWNYDWELPGNSIDNYVLVRSTDNTGNTSMEHYVGVDVSEPEHYELTHYDWDSWLTGGDCTACHHNVQTFLAGGFLDSEDMCYSCHNPSSNAHGRSLITQGHGVMSNITSAGITTPTYGNLTGEFDNRPYANLPGGMVTCVTCHNAMQKSEDVGRVWELTTTPDNLTYTMQNGAWDASGYYEPKVYRDTSLWVGPSNVSDKKAYLVDESEYTYDESAGTVTFRSAQDPAAYIYVTLYYPYLRAGTIGNRLCSDCHPEETHQGRNCMVCHLAHNGANLSYIRDDVRLANTSTAGVRFANRTGANSFADGDGTYNGVCEVCHTATKYYRSDGGGFANHSGGFNYDGTDCTTCHSHASGFPK